MNHLPKTFLVIASILLFAGCQKMELNKLNRQMKKMAKTYLQQEQITDYQNILDTLNSATSTEEVENTVKNMIAKLGTDYNDLEALFKTMIEQYNNEYVMKDTITTSNVYHNNASLFSSSFIVRTIKVSAPIMMVAVLGIAVFYLVRAVRKEKKLA